MQMTISSNEQAGETGPPVADPREVVGSPHLPIKAANGGWGSRCRLDQVLERSRRQVVG